MKTLILIRHANALSSFEAKVQTDAERPLSDEGTQRAEQSAKQLQALDIKPDIILSSPLLRAKQTAQILQETLKADIRIETFLNGLYAEAEVMDCLKDILKEKNTVLAVGHNPNITYLTGLLTKKIFHFSPASFAVIDMTDEENPVLKNFGA